MANLSVFSIRSKITWRILIWLVLIIFVYCEFITYWKLDWTWMDQPSCSPPDCKKLLLVSDPQIIGPEWKNLFLLDVLAIWDSDRYLGRTFRKAFDFLRPDVVLFLGDLMDQGHTASDPEFESYVRRLQKLFWVPSSAFVVLSPGDNDVGGVEDVLIPENVHRFDRRFNQTEDCALSDFLEFCKVNLMTSSMQESKFVNSDLIRVVLTHVPLTPKQSYFLKEVVKKIRPHLIFSGHLHTSAHYATYEDDVWSFRHSSITPEEKRPKVYKFHEGMIHEIIVPTCSYRMGVRKMGYGAAFIDKKKRLVYYNVLWLPDRYLQMLIYLVTILPVVVTFIAVGWKRLARCNQQKRSRKPNRSYQSLP